MEVGSAITTLEDHGCFLFLFRIFSPLLNTNLKKVGCARKPMSGVDSVVLGRGLSRC